MNASRITLIKKITKTGNLKILFSLAESSKKWSQLEKITDKKTLSKSIKELLDLGLIQVSITYDTPTGSKVYELTPLGKKKSFSS